ncbi:hypothetical protein [Streptomyces niveus]|uniref:hypothetical protein n=1 Tax=Streptomyces niveus TaxID=193462 RepID=UPI003648D247
MDGEDGLSPEVRRRIEEAQARMTEELFEETLRAKINFEPDDLGTLLDLVAIGITNSTWRNSCVENWHAEGRLSDGDMMRINSHTTDAIRRRLARWTTEIGITSASGIALAEVDMEEVDTFAIRLFRWTTNPKRKLTIGITLGELARTAEDLREYEDHADLHLGGFAGQMEDRGVRSACSARRAMALSPARIGGNTLPGQLLSSVTSPSSITRLTLTGAPAANGAQGLAPSRIPYRTAPDCGPRC